MLTPVILGPGAVSLSTTAATKVLEDPSAVDVELVPLDETASGVALPEGLTLALALAREAVTAAEDLKAAAEAARLEATAAAFIDEEGEAVTEAATTEASVEGVGADARAGAEVEEDAIVAAGVPETSSTPIELILWLAAGAALSLAVKLEESVSAAKTVIVRVMVVIVSEEATTVEF